LSSGPAGLDAKIKKEVEVNEGGIMWRVRDVWEENYTDVEACDGMPAKGAKEYNWMKHQLSSEPAGLHAKMGIDMNEGGTMWRNREARLLDCITQKKELRPVETDGKRMTQF
jgi:hypothetical protein